MEAKLTNFLYSSPNFSPTFSNLDFKTTMIYYFLKYVPENNQKKYNLNFTCSVGNWQCYKMSLKM